MNDPIRALGAYVAREHDAARNPAVYLERIRRELSSAGVRHAKSTARFRLTSLLVAAAAACIGLAAWSFTRSQLTAVAGAGDALDPGAWIDARVSQQSVRFSDGSAVGFSPGSRARLLALADHGAELSLEMGGAEVSVVHRAETAWRVQAGPFNVKVVGTRFRMAWHPESDRFELTLREGAVVISGCAFGNGQSIVAGETVRASCATPRYEVERATTAAPRDAPAPGQGAESGQRDATAAAPTASQVVVTKPDEAGVFMRFRTLTERGKYEEAFALADGAGFSRLVEQASAGELVQLGDAARYTGHVAQAELAFRALRRRFPKSSQAALARFALARIDFDHRGDFQAAAAGFRAYLVEQPNGQLAREAAGRLIEALTRAGEKRAAQSAAREYLERYPDGPYAAQARALEGGAKP